MKTTSRTRTQWTLLALVLAGIGIVARRHKQETATPAARPASAGALQSTARPVLPPAQAPTEEGAPLATSTTARMMLANYRKESIYPPWSRPAADGSSPHVLDWKPAPRSTLELNRKSGKYDVEMVLDRAYAAPGESITATLVVRRDGEPIDFDASAQISMRAPPGSTLPMSASGPTTVVAAEFTFARASGSSDLRKNVVFTPSRVPELASRPRDDLRFVGLLDLDGEKSARMIELPFSYAVASPFEVLGVRSERVVDGSLVIDLDVDVKLVPNSVYVSAFLAGGSRDSTPIATFERGYQPKRTGRQTLTLTFFGKIIHDVGIDGPYRVLGLHGIVFTEIKGDPEHEETRVPWAYDQPIVTRPYQAGGFSGSEWQDPERTNRINMLDQLARRLDDGTIGSPRVGN